MESEVWKDIEGYGGEYQVSNLGRVKSVKYRAIERKVTEIILKQTKNATGYFEITLTYKGKVKNCRVHRLVLQTFEPIENPKEFVVNHKDRNRANNNLNNLEWLTWLENIRYNSLDMSKDKRSNTHKIIDNLGNQYRSYRHAEKKTGISANTVKNDCLGITNFSKLKHGRGEPRKITFRFEEEPKKIKEEKIKHKNKTIKKSESEKTETFFSREAKMWKALYLTQYNAHRKYEEVK